MIGYFFNFIKTLENKYACNVFEKYKNSKINICEIENLKNVLSENSSILSSKGIFEQKISKFLVVHWYFIEGKKIIKSIFGIKYCIVFGLNNFIIKLNDNNIKDIRYSLIDGSIRKINFIRSYFINYIDFITQSVSLGVENLNIKELFNKTKFSSLTVDNWKVLELNSAI